MSKVLNNKKTLKVFCAILISLVFVYLQEVQLTWSAWTHSLNFKALHIVLVNMLVVGVLYLFIYCISRKLHITVLVSSVVVTILSLVNYHVYAYHGTPFFAGDIYSITTAIGVVGQYKFLICLQTVCLLVIFVFELFLWLIIFFVFKFTFEKSSIKPLLLMLGIDIFAVYCIFFSSFTPFPSSLIQWSWKTAVNEYGYSVCLCNSFYTLGHTINEPDGYDPNLVSAPEPCDNANNKPDIIVILNESLYDLDVYADVPESRELFIEIEEIEDIKNGSSVVSLIGGGTNNTEYELLTSNSMEMLNSSAPFAAMSMKNADSIVSYLKRIGYVTSAMHCCNAENYSRNRAYPDLGFDGVYLDKEYFKIVNTNGSRKWLDIDNYYEMLNFYNEMGDKPRFMYLLTMQNHGGYEQNDSSFDTIIAEGDYGEYDDDVDEFLSSIKLSVDAIKYMIENLKTSQRDTIVLIVGDHAPSFISSLIPKEGLEGIEADIAQKTVPYYIWSNFRMNEEVLQKYTTVYDLLPMTLKAAGIKTSSYYENILELNKYYPVRTASGTYMDADGNFGYINESIPNYELIRNYRYMQYNRINKKSDYKSDWFEVN